MAEIELSVMHHSDRTEPVLTELLREFEKKSGVHVNLQVLRWETGRAELNKIALYHHGPDVSEIGSTWINDMIAMNALRPFSPAETAMFGRPEDFVAESWRSGQQAGDPQQWAIPWLAETYVIHYRRDLLEKAGIDERDAFASHAKLVETARRLKESGVEIPVELPLHLDTYGVLHGLASWVWSAGGDFVADSGREVVFNQPAAVVAIQAYFGLLDLLSPNARRKMRERKQDLFADGKSAIYFGTLSIYINRQPGGRVPRKNWAVAPLPGQHFIGGSNLIIWKHTRADRHALELVRFLTSAEVQEQLALPQAALPPRLASLDAPQIAEDPVMRVFAQSLRTGRSYTSIPLWGLIEDRLVGMLQQIGAYAIAESNTDLNDYIHRQVNAVARRLNLTLEQ